MTALILITSMNRNCLVALRTPIVAAIAVVALGPSAVQASLGLYPYGAYPRVSSGTSWQERLSATSRHDAGARSDGNPRRQRFTPVTREEFDRYAGVGGVTCTLAGGRRRTATAFLVGRFDIAVTVGHTFQHEGEWAAPAACVYNAVAPNGMIVERIPLQHIRAQWQIDSTTFGRTDTDLAVVRLARPVPTARRTLSFSRFAFESAPAMLVGFRSELATETLRRTAAGTVYRGGGVSCRPFAHDIDSRAVSPGAPVVDVRDGVVIGIHASALDAKLHRCAGNAMVPMNSWLERALREEIARPASQEPSSS